VPQPDYRHRRGAQASAGAIFPFYNQRKEHKFVTCLERSVWLRYLSGGNAQRKRLPCPAGPRDPALAPLPPPPLGSIDPRRQARRQIPRPRGPSRALSTALHAPRPPPSGRSARRRAKSMLARSPPLLPSAPWQYYYYAEAGRGLLELERLQPPCREGEGEAPLSACCSGMLSLARSSRCLRPPPRSRSLRLAAAAPKFVLGVLTPPQEWCSSFSALLVIFCQFSVSSLPSTRLYYSPLPVE
jgi:hypothetical protein